MCVFSPFWQFNFFDVHFSALQFLRCSFFDGNYRTSVVRCGVCDDVKSEWCDWCVMCDVNDLVRCHDGCERWVVLYVLYVRFHWWDGAWCEMWVMCMIWNVGCEWCEMWNVDDVVKNGKRLRRKTNVRWNVSDVEGCDLGCEWCGGMRCEMWVVCDVRCDWCGEMWWTARCEAWFQMWTIWMIWDVVCQWCGLRWCGMWMMWWNVMWDVTNVVLCDVRCEWCGEMWWC